MRDNKKKLKSLAERSGVRETALESAFILYVSMLAAAALITLALALA